MPMPLLDGYAKDGKVRADTRRDVRHRRHQRRGAAKARPSPTFRPRKNSARRCWPPAPSSHATPGKTPSGTHMGKVMRGRSASPRRCQARPSISPALDGGVELVASGEAEIGIYPKSEVATVKGLAVVGPLPAGIQLTIVYGARCRHSGSAGCGAAFVAFMAAPEHRAVWTAGGLRAAALRVTPA